MAFGPASWGGSYLFPFGLIVLMGPSSANVNGMVDKTSKIRCASNASRPLKAWYAYPAWKGRVCLLQDGPNVSVEAPDYAGRLATFTYL
jgi:hypothetical protein